MDYTYAELKELKDNEREARIVGGKIQASFYLRKKNSYGRNEKR
jgi:hypothetical protein